MTKDDARRPFEQPGKKEPLDLAALQERLASGQDKQSWRSLEELAESEAFFEFLNDEFPQQTRSAGGLNRRDFLKLMAASFGMAGLAACSPRPQETIMPYVQPPAGMIPGESMYYASAFEMEGYARGVLVRSYMGRPIKIEGNPDHPGSLGSTDAFTQASILDLYDPDRSQVLTSAGQIRTREAFQAALNEALSVQRAGNGAGMRLLTETVSSPTLSAQIEALLETFPGARWHQYDPVGRDNARAGAEMAFGEAVEARYRFEEADVILSLDGDFILAEPGSVRYIRDFTDRRNVLEGQTEMNRLYVVESSFTNTGAVADHRLPMRASQVEAFATLLAGRLGVQGVGAGDPAGLVLPEGWLEALAADLQGSPGASLVIAGGRQPPGVHALAHAMNEALGNVGNTVIYTGPVAANPENQLESLRTLVQNMQAGQVEMLVILGGNPAFNSPADFNFAQSMQQTAFSVYLGLFPNETASLATWHVPGAHYLEMWSDTRAYDGTVSIVQPLIEPLYGGVSPHELLAQLVGEPDLTGYEIVRLFWQEQLAQNGVEEAAFEHAWQQALHNGYIEGTAAEEKQVSLLPGLFAGHNPSHIPISASIQETGQELEIVFEPDPSIWDGRFANNAWLQELPKPLSKITWDNYAQFSPATASRLGLANFDVIELHYRERSIRAPVWIQPGQPDDSVLVYLGYGRRQGGRLLPGTGFNAYAIRSSDAPWFGSGLEIRRTNLTYPLVSTQVHHSMEGRDHVLVGAIEQFRQDPGFLVHEERDGEPPPSLYPEYPYDLHAWGMSINLNTCTGCNACVVACQAENNIPVVGKDQVANSREMHWLRIDSYYEGDLANPDVHFQPMMCVHCEKAPCEPVCPVAATVHSAEGLNEMIYNRCIGTRYCSNNCPYKVRRFNFLQYSEDTIPLDLLHNPDVSVRSRGVMEKCTYCVQRINNARIQAKKEGRPIQEGEVVTACQQACPANAIVFGDINNQESMVHRLKQEPHDYGVLAHLGTQPRTSFLAKMTNRNPDLREDA